jgi:hypothetical protein
VVALAVALALVMVLAALVSTSALLGWVQLRSFGSRDHAGQIKPTQYQPSHWTKYTDRPEWREGSYREGQPPIGSPGRTSRSSLGSRI